MIFPADIPFVWLRDISTLSLPSRLARRFHAHERLLTLRRDKLDDRHSCFRYDRDNIGDMGQSHRSCQLGEQPAFVAFRHLGRRND